MKEKILCVLEYISWSFLNTAGIMAVLFIGMMISLYIAIFMHVNEEKIGLLSISLSILLVYITAYYAFITHKILKEQNKTRQILAIEKELEKAYCPLNEAANTLLLNDHMLNIVEVDQIYNPFNEKLVSVRKNYGYIIFTDNELQKYYREIFNLWNVFIASRDETNLFAFKSSIQRFNTHTQNAISDYNNKMKKLLGEK
jgi:hypothetical protein